MVQIRACLLVYEALFFHALHNMCCHFFVCTAECNTMNIVVVLFLACPSL